MTPRPRCRGFQSLTALLLSSAVALTLPRAYPQEVLFRAEVKLVEVQVTVFEGKRRYVRGLTQDRFRVLDEGKPQPIVAFESELDDVLCTLLLDTTGSMKRTLPTLKNAVVAFIDRLRENDSVAVYGFSNGVSQLQAPTRDKRAAKRAVLATRAVGNTAMFDAVSHVTADLAAQRGKKALIVFTDGDDNASVLNAQAAVNRAHRRGFPCTLSPRERPCGEISCLRNWKGYPASQEESPSR